MQTLTVSDDRVWIQTLAEGQMSIVSLRVCVLKTFQWGLKIKLN